VSEWQAAYWGENGIEIYKMAGQSQVSVIYSGSLDGLKTVSGGRQRRILILGRHNTVRLRKRYPPLKMNKLMQAVEIEAPDIFPLRNCSFHCRIAETYATHIIVDIWAWERVFVESLHASFAFQYIIPEELTFLSLPSGIYIYGHGSNVQIIAAGDGKFLDAASRPGNDFSSADLKVFLAGLSDNIASIREIRFYGNTSVEVPPSFTSRAKNYPVASAPPFLEALKGLPVKPFRRKKRLLLKSLNTKRCFGLPFTGQRHTVS